MRFLRSLPLITLLILLAVSGSIGLAQDESSGACPALVEQALAQMGAGCASLDRNTACYGYTLVETQFTEAVADDTFTEPADRAPLADLLTLRTAPLNLDTGDWGIAVLSAQANIPDTLPGQAVTFVVMGDAEIENQVAGDAVAERPEPAVISASVRSNIRSGPGRNFNVIGAVDPGVALEADAVSDDGGWFRIVYDERIGWISADVVEESTAAVGLPASTDPDFSPMRAFYFRTGFGTPDCAEAPDIIAIRSPDNLTVDLTVNGIDIRVGSLITLQNLSEDQMLLTVIEGEVETRDGDGEYFPIGGQTLTGEMTDDGTIFNWLDPADATDDQLENGELFEVILDELAIEAEDLQDDTTAEPTEEPTIFTPQTGVDCSTFRATSPTLGLGYGINAFYWDAAQGVDGYRVTVNNETAGGSVSGETTVTSIALDLTDATIGPGFDFSWIVEALAEGEVVCTSERIRLQRGSQAAPPPPSISVNAECVSEFQILVTWSGFPPTDSVTLVYFGMPEDGNIGSLPPSGSYDMYNADLFSGTLTGSPSGLSASLPQVLGCG
jgi:hypothetical protein